MRARGQQFDADIFCADLFEEPGAGYGTFNAAAWTDERTLERESDGLDLRKTLNGKDADLEEYPASDWTRLVDDRMSGREV